jgi:predicted PurR-regulated permease PerM
VAKVSAIPCWQRALVILTGTVVGVVVVSCLYWAQTVFVPVALAVFLTFLLAPVVTILQRRGMGRILSVVLVVLLATLLLGGVVWLVTVEITSLGDDLPKYTENIKGKIRSLRQMGQSSAMNGLEKMIQDLTQEWESQPAGSEGEGADQPARPGGAAPTQPSAVVPQPDSPAWLSRVPALLRPLAEALGGLALALVLVVFMLLKREDLRNRVIRLVGHGRLTVMTKAVDDAGQRISRFLLMQLIVNGSVGL